MTIVAFGVGFIAAAALAAWKPPLFQRVVTWTAKQGRFLRGWIAARRSGQ